MEQPIFTIDGCPPWFNRSRRDLERDYSTYLQPLQSTNRLNRQRPGRYDGERLKTKNYVKTKNYHFATHRKGPVAEDEGSLLRRLNHEVVIQQYLDGRPGDEHALHLAQRDGRGYRQILRASGSKNDTSSSHSSQFQCTPSPRFSGTLKFFEPGHPRFTEGFVTDEVTAYVVTMPNITRTMKSKKSSTTGTVFMSPPGCMFLPSPYNSSYTWQHTRGI